MTEAEFLATIAGSTVEQWRRLNTQTMYGWEHGHNQRGNFIEPKTFELLAVFKNEIDISLAIGATVADDFEEPWTAKFADSSAHSVAVHFRFRGAVVYEWVGVYVDGGRYLLPMPTAAGAGAYVVEQERMPLARLMFDLAQPGGVHTSLEDALNRAGIQVI